jgi:SAM-dependent methyltransferase
MKSWCATCYEDPALVRLTDGTLHPGGSETTLRLARRLGLGPGSEVLDVACGPGRSAGHLAQAFGCRITGLDYGLRSVVEARKAVPSARFVAGDAEQLPFVDARFDAVVVECSLCLFPNKPVAVGEIYRVLKPGGTIGIADVALERPLPPGLDERISWVTCLAGACTSARYRQLLQDVGFSNVSVEDASWALEALVHHLGRWLFLLDVGSSLGKGSGLPVSPVQAREWLDEARRWIADGSARYLLITGRRMF